MMDPPVMEERYKGYLIQVFQDTDALNPREDFDHLGTMICFHRRYNLGDKHTLTLEEAKEFFRPSREDIFYLPLYLYDHSGLTMNTTGFSCPWDSGQVGWIYVSKADVRKEFGKRITRKIEKKVYEILRAEVTEYDQYLTGDVYGYEVNDLEGDTFDSCWGFYGHEYIEKELLPELRTRIDEEIRERAKRTKAKVRMRKFFEANIAPLLFCVLFCAFVGCATPHVKPPQPEQDTEEPTTKDYQNVIMGVGSGILKTLLNMGIWK